MPAPGLLRRLPWFLAAPIAAVWLVGQWFRDATWLTGLCFYVPSPLVAIAFGIWWIVAWRHREWRHGWLALGLMLPPLVVTLLLENQPLAARRASLAADFRLVHWNVGSQLRLPRTRETLIAARADVYVLSEVGESESVERLREALGEEYRAVTFSTLAVLARGRLTLGERWLERRRTLVQSVNWEQGGRALELFVVDLPSELNVPRDPLLREVHALIERQQPALIVGDFNAPRRSRALSQLPAGYGHAFEAAGSGCGYTWPSPLPVLAIDHCIHGPQIVPVRYRLQTSLISDHCLQVFDAAIRRNDSP
uniref:Endonuclease/exonuclease/phosphatase domain-containing protein n=1 Tax=Schlesneria paludicola TaxID=360056 RepID=A0A7C2P0X0_9PLAN